MFLDLILVFIIVVLIVNSVLSIKTFERVLEKQVKEFDNFSEGVTLLIIEYDSHLEKYQNGFPRVWHQWRVFLGRYNAIVDRFNRTNKKGLSC